MVKNAFKWLWIALLVLLPAVILLTGWTEAVPYAKWGAAAYGALTLTSVILLAVTIRSAMKLRGEDFGEKHHLYLLAAAKKNAALTSFAANFHALRALPSCILLLAIGLPVSAALVFLTSVALYVSSGAIERYAYTYGRPATTAGRTSR